MTAVSSDMAGIANYTIKRDWRRVLEHEIRAEGYDWFFPDPTQDRTEQCVLPGSGDDDPTTTSYTVLNSGSSEANGYYVYSQTALGEFVYKNKNDYVLINNSGAFVITDDNDSTLYTAPSISGPWRSVTGDLPLPNVTIGSVVSVIAQARQPNGRIAVVAGTATSIFRFFGVEDGHYAEEGYWVDGYYNDEPGTWVMIGSGYSANARRWEAVSINGYLVLNNGVDLPFTYRVEDLQVYPIYELREQGIAAVGTIAEHEGILLCMDLYQINQDRLTQLLSPVPFTRNFGQPGVVSSGTTRAVVNSGVAGVAGSTITASDATFNGGAGFTGMSGKSIRMANGLTGTITGVTSSTVATLSISGLSEPNQPFYLPSATGTEFQIPLNFTTDVIASCNTSAVTTAATNLATAQTNLTNANAVLAADQAILTAYQAVAAGSTTGTALADALTAAQTATILNPNNTSLIAAVAAATAALVANPAPSPAQIAAAQAQVTADEGVVETASLAFAAAQQALEEAQESPNYNSDTDVAAFLTNQNMVIGLQLYWASGEVRTITGWYGGGVTVDSDQPIPSGPCGLENPLAYATFPQQSSDQPNVQRIGYRMFWSMPNQPRRWGSVIPCTLDPTSNRIMLTYPAKSVPELITEDFLVLGAGAGGGNLTVTASWALNNQIVDANAAITTAAEQLETALTTAQLNQANATAASAVAIASLNQANISLASAKAALNLAIPNYATLFAALTNAQDALTTAQTSLNTANGNYATAQATLAAAQNALAASPSTLSLQQAVNTAQTAANAAQESVNVAQTSVNVAQTGLQNAQSAIDTTPNEANLIAAVATAQAQVQTSQAQVVATAQALLTANSALVTAQQALLPVNSTLEAADAFGSIIAFDDLQDDGAEILKAASLKGTLCIFKSSNNIFLGTYTGDLNTPWNFVKVPTPEGTELYYRNTLIGAKGANVMWQTVSALYLIYAGRNVFYRFDLTNQVPVEIPDFQMCQDIFFANAPDTEQSFAVDNPVTREIFFVIPGAATDAILRYDYRFNTMSTSSAQIYAAGVSYRPTSTYQYTDAWFLMGGPAGLLLRYGRVNDSILSSGSVTASIAINSTTLTASAPFFNPAHVGQSVRFPDDTILAIVGFIDNQNVTVAGSAVENNQPFTMVNAIWHRLGLSYDSTLQTGMEAFGSPDSEKLLTGYVPFLTDKSPSTPLTVTFRGARNPGKPVDIITSTLPDPQNLNLLRPVVQQFYIGDRILVSGINNPCELAMKSFRFSPINSQSFSRGK